MEEIWKIIPGTYDLYEASNLGKVRRVGGYIRNNINGGQRNLPSKILSAKVKSNKYREVSLHFSTNGHKMMYVHRAVVSAFVGEIPAGMGVNHKDGDKNNNHLSNLEIVTYSQNSKHAYKIGLVTPSPQLGSKHGMSKVTDADVLKIRELYASGMVPRIIAQNYNFNISISNISSICYRLTWRHI